LTLSLIVYVLVVFAAWAYAQVFGARAAYIHTGTFIGTIMVWNVYFHIIPGQKRVVAAIRAGQPVDPQPGIIGKQRSVHNTYFTLPVLFIMISSHYPMTFGHRHAWAVLAVLILAGALIRQYFVARHRGKNLVALPSIAAVLIAGLVIALAPSSPPPSTGGADKVTYKEIEPILAQRCVACHAAQPTFPGFVQPPAGLRLETAAQAAAAAQKIQQQAITTQVMPPGNLTKITDEERNKLARWLAAGAPVQ
jgi:uncharacterized membrane protein